MSVPLLDLTAQYAAIRGEVDAAIAEVTASQRFILGRTVEAFEASAAEYVGAAHAVGCASGTDALVLALRALELEPGDEVIVPAFTFFATAGAVWNVGLRPVFADIDPVSFNVTAETVEAALSDRTRAVIVVHLFGQLAGMSELMRLARDHGLAVIEDAAQAIGSRAQVDGDWRSAGTVGIMGCFSFFPSKNLGGFGDGGMITTGDEGLAQRVATLRMHGAQRSYEHELVGTNSRLDALQAAVLSAKLPHLPRWTEARRRNATSYDEQLRPLAPAVRTPRMVDEPVAHVWNQYTVRAERRDELKEFLTGRGIGSAIYYPLPLHLQPCFAELGYRRGDLPESERAAEEVLSLPVYPELAPAQIAEVSRAVADFYS